MRILEISDQAFVQGPATAAGHQVDLYDVGGGAAMYGARFNWSAMRKVRAQIQRGEYDLIAISTNLHPLWRADRGVLRSVASLISRAIRKSHTLGLSLLPYIIGDSKVPVMMYYRKDAPILAKQNFGLFPICDRIFVRELPQNNWNLFLYTTSKNEDVLNVMRQPLFKETMPKIRPLPLGFDNPLEEYLPASANKQTDIFYAGRSHSSTVRSRGLAHLEKLRALGYKVDAPTQLIPREEFYRRAAEAWIVWSPEGQGWDCHRHYESLLVGSVPLINYPTMERYQPLEHGKHCLLYGIEGDEMIRVATEALKNKEQLRAIAAAGREHIFRWHTHDAYVRHMIEETMGAVSE